LASARPCARGGTIDWASNSTYRATPRRTAWLPRASLQFEPSAIYALRDHVSDSIWLRPYAGAGINFSHQTWNPAPGTGTPTSDNKVGGQIFGGAEVTFPSLPKLAVSADLGYHWTPNAFPGVSLGGFGLSLAGHWYIK